MGVSRCRHAPTPQLTLHAPAESAGQTPATRHSWRLLSRDGAMHGCPERLLRHAVRARRSYNEATARTPVPKLQPVVALSAFRRGKRVRVSDDLDGIGSVGRLHRKQTPARPAAQARCQPAPTGTAVQRDPSPILRQVHPTQKSILEHHLLSDPVDARSVFVDHLQAVSGRLWFGQCPLPQLVPVARGVA